jgi:uncharacterized protein YkwD
LNIKKYLLIISLLIISSSALAIDDFILRSNHWKILSLPANPGANNTVENIFGNNIAPSDYGQKWVLYSYNATSNQYDPLTLSSQLEQGVGYWIIQITDSSVTLDMPQGSRNTSPDYSIKLTSPQGGSAKQWNLAGYPFSDTRRLGDFYVQSSEGVCSNPTCDIAQAKSEKLLHNQVWVYDGRKYVIKDQDANLSSWDGFWAVTLEKSLGRTLSLAINYSPIPVLPKGDIQRFLGLVNDARKVARSCGDKGDFPAVPALVWSDKLYKAAYEHSQDLATSNTFSHAGSGTESDWTGFKLNKPSSMPERIESYNYKWSAIAENIAAGNETAESTIQQWLNSPGHCANLMSHSVTQIGMAKASNSSSGYIHYWTQNFGKPR